MLVPAIEILKKAEKEGYVVGAFNTFDLESTQAIVQAAHELNSPVIVQITTKTMDYAGGRMIFSIVKNMAEKYCNSTPIAIHLDHGRSMEVIQRAVEIGFHSVMYDGSKESFGDNVRNTKAIVDFCHPKGVAVQAELGNVPYLSEQRMGQTKWEEYMTPPDKAKEFVEQTNVDTLAVAIGNAHGFFPEKKEPDWERLEKIKSLTNIPLILHGASDWDEEKVRQAAKKGITCFNVDTNTRLAFINTLSALFRNNGDAGLDPRKVLGEAREAVKESVKQKIKIFGSEGKA